MILAGPYTMDVADLHSRALMRAIARINSWRWVSGMGMPPGKQQGPGPRNLPGQGYATHWTPSFPAKTDGQVYLQLDTDMELLSPGATEFIDGENVELVRTGVELDLDAVLKSRVETETARTL